MPVMEDAEFAARAANYQRRRRDAICDISESGSVSVASSLSQGSDNARLGVVFLFAHLRADPKVASIVLDGGLRTSGCLKTIDENLLKLDRFHGGAMDKINKGQVFCDQVSGKDVIKAGKPLMQKVADGIETGNHKEKTKRASNGWDPMTENMMEAYLHSLVSQIAEKVRKAFKSEQFYGSVIHQVAKSVISYFYEELTKIVTGGLKTIKAAGKAIKGVIQQIQLWISRRFGGFTLRPGHPSEAVNAITWGMTTSNFVGLYDSIKQGVMFAANIATAGAAKLLEAIAAIAELATKLFWRIHEANTFNAFCGWCKEAWEKRSNPGAPHKEPRVFAERLNQTSGMCPEIGAIILRSGCCGDKTQWIDCYTYGNHLHRIAAPHFQAGASYLEKLKGPALSLLQDCGLLISAQHATAQAYLGHATRDLSQPAMSVMQANGKRTWVAQKKSKARKAMSLFWTSIFG